MCLISYKTIQHQESINKQTSDYSSWPLFHLLPAVSPIFFLWGWLGAVPVTQSSALTIHQRSERGATIDERQLHRFSRQADFQPRSSWWQERSSLEMGPMDIPTQRTETNVGSSHLKFWCLKKRHFLLGWLMFGCHDNFSEVFRPQNKRFVFFTLRNQDSKHGNPEQIHIASCCQQNVKEIYDIVSYENKSFCCKSHHYTKGVPNNSQNFPNLPQVSPPEALRDRHSSRPNRSANLQYPSDDQILQSIGKQNGPHEMIWNHETSNSTEFETFVILHPGRRKTPLRPDPSPWPTRPSINPWAKIMVKRITFAMQRQTAWSIEKNSNSTINGGPAINELARL